MFVIPRCQTVLLTSLKGATISSVVENKESIVYVATSSASERLLIKQSLVVEIIVPPYL